MSDCTPTKSREVPALSGGSLHGAMNEDAARCLLPATCYLLCSREAR